MAMIILDTINLVTAWVAVGVITVGLAIAGFGDKILKFLEARYDNRHDQRDDKEE